VRPSLIFLPYVAYLDSTLRQQLGLQGLGAFVDSVGHHELAHQWWGHQVGWQSYRDAWLSEGLAEFTVALVQQHTAGLRRYNEFWESSRRRIVAKSGEVGNDEAGPLTLGFRQSTRRAPGAYGAMVYDKGAYVLHMLRMASPSTPSWRRAAWFGWAWSPSRERPPSPCRARWRCRRSRARSW
jgi:hypothetical protein